eukprot:GGOE01020199.1.p1 GENE.GGOE01020199.1~~GGOE01020199.1.p1  ORF type:complete len:551 (-),score=70.07 GGOE01020199.1:385-1878(-)
MEGDGNCLYRALAYHVGCDWQPMKDKIFQSMKQNPAYREQFEAEVSCDFKSFDEYVETKWHGKGSKSWGSTPEIIVFCDIFETIVAVFTYNSTVTMRGSHSDLQEASHSTQKQARIAHVGGNHYDALVECGEAATQEVKPRYCRELRVREEHCDTEIVRIVDLYEDSCIYDIVRVLNLHVQEPFQLYIAPWAPGERSTYVLLDEESFEVVVKGNKRLSVLVQGWKATETLSVDKWISRCQPAPKTPPVPSAPSSAALPQIPAPHAPTPHAPTPLHEVSDSSRRGSQELAPPAPQAIASASLKPPPPVSARHSPRNPADGRVPSPKSSNGGPDRLELPPGVEPKGTISFKGCAEEVLLFEAVLTNLRSIDQRGQNDEGLALYLSPTKVYGTSKDGSMFMKWDIVDCLVEQSMRKPLDKRYFNLTNREKDIKVHLYSNDRFHAAQIKLIVDFFTDQQTKTAKLLASLHLRSSRSTSQDKPSTSSEEPNRRFSALAHKIL